MRISDWSSDVCSSDLKVFIVGNSIIRQKTDDSHPDSADYPQQRGCLRGRSQRRHVLGPDRLRYPMIRKNWSPGGGDKSLRGRDRWVRISWDQAHDIVASETRRITGKYGQDELWLTGKHSDRKSTRLNSSKKSAPHI